MILTAVLFLRKLAVAIQSYCESVGFSGAPDELLLATSFEIERLRFQGMIYIGR